MNAADRVLLSWLLTFAFCSGARAAAPEPSALAQQAQALLKAHCYRCHGHEGANEGGFNFVLDRQQLVKRKKIVPGDAAKSRLFKRLVSEDEPMPPQDEKVRPSKEEIALLRKWIDAGAPDFQAAVAARPFLSPDEVIRAVRADLGTFRERDRRFLRYFTLTHLANAGLADDELQSYRHGLSKLVNSLSWGPRVVGPTPLLHGTLFRIDLRDYQWNEKVWDSILALNPYGIIPPGQPAQIVQAWTGTFLPLVRADWFVAAASRPPLYHDVLQLPRTETELEKLLRVDVAENLRQGRVARAGFNSSGVSRNNRLIERHEAGSVVYWRSYDFSSNTGRRNLFAHPLGPGGEGGFEADGGEIIFNLPNGLQGYLLVDSQGRRINKGPTEIVSDPKRPDRAVENGLSCMSCHAKGMLPKSDQVRKHVLANAGSFLEADVESVRTLYPPEEQFAALIQKDARRFQEAVAQTGAPLSSTEPIAALALRFEAEMDLALAAAEAGVTAEQLLRALDRFPDLARRLGPLRVGSTVQRQVFVDAFADLVEALRVGTFVPPRPLAAARLVRRGDWLFRQKDVAGSLDAFAEALRLDPDSTEALIARGDVFLATARYDRAVADYDAALRLDPKSALVHNNRGLAFKRQGEPERAIADFTTALRLDPRLAVAFHNRGAVHHSRGDHDRAIADFTEAIRLEPQSAVAHNNRGLAWFDKGDLDRAIADFTRALRLDPKLAVALNNRGLAYSRKENLVSAIADFTAAIEIDPQFARAYFNRSIAYEKKGDETRARADYERAVRLDPNLDSK